MQQHQQSAVDLFTFRAGGCSQQACQSLKQQQQRLFTFKPSFPTYQAPPSTTTEPSKFSLGKVSGASATSFKSQQWSHEENKENYNPQTQTYSFAAGPKPSKRKCMDTSLGGPLVDITNIYHQSTTQQKPTVGTGFVGLGMNGTAFDPFALHKKKRTQVATGGDAVVQFMERPEKIVIPWPEPVKQKVDVATKQKSVKLAKMKPATRSISKFR